MLNKRLKSAVIGVGVIGSMHAKILDRMGELVAICDTDISRAREVAAGLTTPVRIYTDYERLLEDERPDIVHISTPHHLHAEMIIKALGQNINVLCEKPMCISEDEIGAILDAEARSSAILGVCHQNRYSPASVFLKEYIDRVGIKTAYGSVAWHRDEKYYKSAPWRGKIKTAGGGVLINQALHTLDLLEWFSGEPTDIKASVGRLSPIPDVEVEDTVSATFLGEHPFTLLATNTTGDHLPVQITVKLANGEYATMTQDRLIIDGRYYDLKPEDAVAPGKPYYGIGHPGLIADFHDCVKSDRRFPIDGKEGAKVIRLILEVYKWR